MIAYALHLHLAMKYQIISKIDDDDEVMNREPPSEKERKNMVIVVSCVGLIITILAATMVGITLGLSHLFEEPDLFLGRNISGK